MIDLERLRSLIAMKMQAMTSAEADFEKKTWTFEAPSFVCKAGTHLLISERDWIALWDELLAADGDTAADEATAAR